MEQIIIGIWENMLKYAFHPCFKFKLLSVKQKGAEIQGKQCGTSDRLSNSQKIWNLLPHFNLKISWLPDIVLKYFCTPDRAMGPTFQMNSKKFKSQLLIKVDSVGVECHELGRICFCFLPNSVPVCSSLPVELELGLLSRVTTTITRTRTLT